MCNFSRQSEKAVVLEKRFDAKIKYEESLYSSENYVGPIFPRTPVISDAAPTILDLYEWGLIPAWANIDFKRKFTLNARIETVCDKPSFRNYVKNRCLVIVNGFYEWQWLDTKGKQKKSI
jgi:putative SOS response-associated peptidase YedK